MNLSPAQTVGPANEPRRTLRRIETALWILAAPGLLLGARVVVESLPLLRLPYETSRPEAFVLEGARRVAEGRPLYLDLETLPFVVHVYNPLTYLPTGWAARGLGLDLGGTLFLGRIASWLAALLLAGVLAAFVRRETGSTRAAALAAGGLFFFHSVTLTDFFRFRPESTGLLLTFAGVAIFLSGHRRRIEIAAGLFSLAFAFKQPFLAAPVAACLASLAARRFREAARFAAVLGLLLGAFAAAMAVWSDGRYYECAVRSMAANAIDPLRALREHHAPLARRLWGLLLAGPIGLALLPRDRVRAFLGAYLAVEAVWTFLAAGKFGSWLNYYSELAVLLVLITALAAGSGRPGESAGRRAGRLAVLGLVAAHVVWSAGFERRTGGFFSDVPYEDIEPWVEPLRAHEGRQLITNERLAVHVGDPQVLDWVLLQHLAERGVFDVSQLFDAIARGEYDWIVVDPRVTTRLEIEILKATKAGPYEKVPGGPAGRPLSVFRRKGS